jgi:hypothetical protein
VYKLAAEEYLQREKAKYNLFKTMVRFACFGRVNGAIEVARTLEILYRTSQAAQPKRYELVFSASTPSKKLQPACLFKKTVSCC